MSDGDLDPYFDPGPFGFILIGDVVVACTLVSVDGCVKPEDWKVQKGNKTSGANAVWGGTGLAETIKLKFRANDGPSFAAMGDLYTMVRPALGQKPPTLPVENGIVNWGGVGQIALKTPAQPVFVPAQNAWDFEWEFIEYDPSIKADTGAAKAPDPDGKDPPDKQSEADKEIDKLQKQVDKL